SKEDLTQKISKSIFMTNFPDHISARDLWGTCKAYGTVVDVYIPYKKSKAETIGREVPSLVLDDICFSDRDFNLSLMGKIKDTTALPNHYVILEEKGSWFSSLQPASNSFISDERIVWISIEGLPLKVWSFNTFVKIASKWGELVEWKNIEDNNFSRNVHWVRAKEMEGWDPLLRNEDYASSSSDEENEQENEGSRNGEKFHSKRNSVNEVHEKEMEASSEEVKQNSYNSVRNNSLNASYCSQRFKAGDSTIDLMDELVKVEQTMGYNMDGSICLDKHLCDHRPILMCEMNIDYGPTPFRFFHSWFQIEGFDKLVEDTWMHMDITYSNGMILLKKKQQALRIIIREWTENAKKCSYKKKSSIQSKLSDIDKIIDQGGSNEVILNDRYILIKELYDIISLDLEEMAQKAKVRWAIEGDENSKYFHGILNNKRSHLAIRGVLVNDDWIVKPNDVKNEFLNHFSSQFDRHVSHRICLVDVFNNQLSLEQHDDLERTVSIEEIKRAKFIENDISVAVMEFFSSDDAVFVRNWDSSNLKIILKVLKCFHMASGLKININKSKLMGYGVHSDEVETAGRYIGCATFVSPFSHLGVKVGGRMERINSWDDVVSKVTSRLSKWKLKTLYIGGRLTLIKSVLTSIPLYQMSSFIVPIKVLNILELIRRKFFNGVEGNERKLALISWDTVLASKKYGAIHCEKVNLGAHGNITRRSPWLDIVREINVLRSKGIDFLSLIRKKVGNCEDTLFWEDTWFDGISLKQQFSRLYSLESAKHINVAEKMNHPSLSWSYRREPRGGIDEEQQNMLFLG
nr:RNA-directed DNA polymerase, eukaryota [Tanacetum cinerariifolium]